MRFSIIICYCEMTGEITTPIAWLLSLDPMTFLSVAIFLLTFLWIAAVVWTLKDSIARTSNIWFHILAVLLVTVFTPLFGIPLYLAIRPIYYHPRKLYARAMLRSLTVQCDSCGTRNPCDHYFCLQCGDDLTVQCANCETYYPKEYLHCFHCGASKSHKPKEIHTKSSHKTVVKKTTATTKTTEKPSKNI